MLQGNQFYLVQLHYLFVTLLKFEVAVGFDAVERKDSLSDKTDDELEVLLAEEQVVKTDLFVLHGDLFNDLFVFRNLDASFFVHQELKSFD